MSLPMTEGEGTIQEIMDAMVDKHIPYIEDAGKQGVQILCLQEIFNTRISVRARTANGTRRQRLFRDLLWKNAGICQKIRDGHYCAHL